MAFFFNRYPYTDFHELNLDWIISKIKEIKDSVIAAAASEEAATSSAEAAAGSAEAAAGSAEAAAGSAEVAQNVADNFTAGAVNQYWAGNGTGNDPSWKDLPYVTPEMFGAKGDGVTDDTTAFNDAITYAAANNYKIVCVSGKTYIIEQIVPVSNTILDLNSSTIKLKDESEKHIFSNTSSETKNNLVIVNGILDGNQTNNHASTNSAGGIYLEHFNNIEIDVEMKNLFREGIYWSYCDNAKINLYVHDSGQTNNLGTYSYGGSLNFCNNIIINNVKVYSMFGYGFHIRECTNVTANNFIFSNISRSSYGIGLTITSSNRVIIDKIIGLNCESHTLEHNASTNVIINSLIADGSNIPIIFGDNQTGNNNIDVTINNLITKNTGSNYSLNINYCNNVKITNFTFDKKITTTVNVPSENISFSNGIFETGYDSIMDQARFVFYNVKLLTATQPIYIDFKTRKTMSYRVPIINLANNGVQLVPIISSYFAGTASVFSYFDDNNNQGSIYRYIFYKGSSVFNITQLSEYQNGSYGRKVTIDHADSDYDNIRITNGTGVSVSGWIIIE